MCCDWRARLADATPAPDRIAGLAAQARHAYGGGDLQAVAAALIARLERDGQDAAAMLDLAYLFHARGQSEAGAALMDEALRLRHDYRIVLGRGTGPRVLALVAPGDLMANTPLDFLLAGSDAVLHLHFVTPDDPLTDLPPHDVAMLAIGEAPDRRALLRSLAPRLAAWPRPVVNAAADRIAGLTRDGVARRLQGVPGLVCPPTLRLTRAGLAPLLLGAGPETLHPGLDWPLILRPEGSHAGAGMERVGDALHLADLLAETGTERFYLTRFVDYRGANGLFAKARVVLIDGRPYPVHLALSQDWIVHYLSAGMDTHADRRAAEAAWIAGFADGFARRHAAALAALADRIGLDYVGLDCAELPDGRLLVFEVDVALIVHDMDDAARFPAKPPAMRQLFAAFQALLAAKAAGFPCRRGQLPHKSPESHYTPP